MYLRARKQERHTYVRCSWMRSIAKMPGGIYQSKFCLVVCTRGPGRRYSWATFPNLSTTTPKILREAGMGWEEREREREEDARANRVFQTFQFLAEFRKVSPLVSALALRHANPYLQRGLTTSNSDSAGTFLRSIATILRDRVFSSFLFFFFFFS